MLNEEQKNAVTEISRPLVVIAGPGTGKTTLITEKINYLITKKNISRDEILAITFTNKAANEMSKRVEINTQKPFFAKTFHQFALELIEEYHALIPQIDMNYKLLDETNQILFFLENINQFKLSSIEIKNNQVLISHELASTISKLKDFGIRLKDFEKLPCDDISSKMDVFIGYSKYEIFKKNNNFVDFGDLLLYIHDLLKNNENIRKEISDKYKYILVDEFQDTNKVQFEIISLIAKENNITIVGDQKQSIYSFRGANYENLVLFKKKFTNYNQIFLNNNYRSSKKIIENINKIVSNLTTDDELLIANIDEIGISKLIEAKTQKAQFTFLAQEISKIQNNDPQAKIGILFRRKSEIVAVSAFLKNLGIIHNANEITNIFELPVIKDVQSQLKIILNPRQANKELFKLLVDFQIKNETARKISRAASLREKSIYEILDIELDLNEDEKELLINIKNKIDTLLVLKSANAKLSKIVKEVIFKFNNYNNSILIDDVENIYALNKFLNFAENFANLHDNDDLEKFLLACIHTREIGFNFETDENVNNIELHTLHSSKGKEYDYVFMPYLNERRFPASFKRSNFEIIKSSKEQFLDEEKRLFFVGVSRAKKQLFLIYVLHYETNKSASKPSEFLNLLNLNKVVFDKEIDDLKPSKKEEVKLELIAKVQTLLINNQFVQAKSYVDLLKNLFEKKDLSHFMPDKLHADYDFYNNKINGVKNKNVFIEPSKMIYSVSQLKTYESCPKKYLFGYVYKIPGESRHYFDFGSSLHKVLENLVHKIKEYPKEVLYAKAISDLKENWISKGYENVEQERDYFQKGIEAIKSFIGKELEILKDGREIVELEKKFIIEIEGRKILGFIDRIDKVGDDYELLDYKTSNSRENVTQLKNNLQLFVYMLAVKQSYNKLPKKAGLWYLLYDEIVSVETSQINSKELKLKILELIDGIEKENFSPNPSFFSCKFCDYNSICKDSK